MIKVLIGILIGMAIITTVALYSRPLAQKQYLYIDGHLINYDHIVDASKLNDHLYLWTATPSGWRNGVKTQYRKFKLSKDEVNACYYMIASRWTRN